MNTTVMGGQVGWAVASSLAVLDNQLVKVNRQAAKLGVPPVSYVRTGRTEQRFLRERKNALGERVREYLDMVEIEIHGEIPKLPGDWTLLAVVNHEEGLPIVNAVPGFELPAGQRDRGTVCDHCGTSRRRSDTFVLQAADGRVVQVGRNCLADFLGLSAYNPSALLALAAFLREPFKGLGFSDFEPGDYDNGPRGRLMIDVGSVVLAAAAAIDEEGWMSRTKANMMGSRVSTADSVGFILWPPFNPTRDDIARIERYRTRMNDALRAEACAAIEWAKGLLGSEKDYLNNLGVCASRETVGADKLGLVVSLVATYRRERETLRQRERKPNSSTFVGEVGKRQEFELTLAATPRAIEGNYGTTYRTEFTDASGNVFVWWASNDPCHGGRDTGWKVGESRKVKATVKKHEAFKGVATTTLSRVKETK